MSNRQHNNSSKEGAGADATAFADAAARYEADMESRLGEAGSDLHHHNTNDGGAAQCGVCGAAAGSIYPSLLNGYRGILPFIAQLKW